VEHLALVGPSFRCLVDFRSLRDFYRPGAFSGGLFATSLLLTASLRSSFGSLVAAPILFHPLPGRGAPSSQSCVLLDLFSDALVFGEAGV